MVPGDHLTEFAARSHARRANARLNAPRPASNNLHSRLWFLPPADSVYRGQPRVDDWLATRALQNQEKPLSVTKVLLDAAAALTGYCTLAIGQVDFGELPTEITRKLPHCIDAAAKAFYRHYNFEELPGHPYRLFLSAQRLAAMVGEK